MKSIYLDLSSGISGDMFLGALLDLGAELGALETELRKLGLTGYHLQVSRQKRHSISGIKFDVHLLTEGSHEHPPESDHDHRKQKEHGLDMDDHHHHPDEHGNEHQHRVEHEHGDGPAQAQSHSHHHGDAHSHEHGRSFSQIERLIKQSGLSSWVKEKAVAVFARIARAEGKIHDYPPGDVHFHEVGAVDSIVDIVGGCIALEQLGRPRLLASRVVEGHGFVRCAHGRFPIPVAATVEILAHRQIPVTQIDEEGELVTPTGAAFLAEFVGVFGLLQNFAPARVGYGIGTRDPQSRPNVLRAILSETSSTAEWEADTLAILETNLDDASPELLGFLAERLLGEGALDVFYVPVVMKKNRPGLLLTVLCVPEQADQFTQMILRESTSFGVRRSQADRRKLAREILHVATPYGSVEVKIGRLGTETLQVAPEYESCRRLAMEQHLPLQDVYQAAVMAARSRIDASR